MPDSPALRRLRFHRTEGDVTLIPIFSRYTNNYVLSAGVATSVVVPAGAHIALFACDHDFFVDWLSDTAVVPSGNVTDGTGVEMNPGARVVTAGQTLSVISAANAILTVSYYGNAQI